MRRFNLGRFLITGVLCSAMLFTACGADKAPSGTNSTDTNSTGTNSESANTDVLRVAMECVYAPYNWTQPTNENGAVQIKGSTDFANGYDVAMAKLIAEKLGKTLEIVKLDWESLVPAVQSGTVDCVIAGQSITTERMQKVDFTKPYYYASIVTLVKKDGPYAKAASIADLEGATGTSQQNTVWYNDCLPQVKNAKILPAQESAPNMIVALLSGKCEIVVTDMPTAMAACAAQKDLMLLDFSKSGSADADFKVSEEEINIGVSLKKGNTELQEKINSVLGEMTADDFTKMMDEAIKIQPLAQ